MLSSWPISKSRFRSAEDSSVRRVAHGGNPYVMGGAGLMQPQDGAEHEATEVRARVAEFGTRLSRLAMLEPEDARITGGTRSLMRRLVGLNVRPAVRQKLAPVVAIALRNQPKVA